VMGLPASKSLKQAVGVGAAQQGSIEGEMSRLVHPLQASTAHELTVGKQVDMKWMHSEEREEYTGPWT
jgi:uncharacterized OB-fold protein